MGADRDQGKHVIEIDHTTMGQTCGILPVGVDSAFVTTQGLKWNLGTSHISWTMLTYRLGNIIRRGRLKLESPLTIRATCPTDDEQARHVVYRDQTEPPNPSIRPSPPEVTTRESGE